MQPVLRRYSIPSRSHPSHAREPNNRGSHTGLHPVHHPGASHRPAVALSYLRKHYLWWAEPHNEKWAGFLCLRSPIVCCTSSIYIEKRIAFTALEKVCLKFFFARSRTQVRTRQHNLQASMNGRVASNGLPAIRSTQEVFRDFSHYISFSFGTMYLTPFLFSLFNPIVMGKARRSCIAFTTSVMTKFLEVSPYALSDTNWSSKCVIIMAHNYSHSVRKRRAQQLS